MKRPTQKKKSITSSQTLPINIDSKIYTSSGWMKVVIPIKQTQEQKIISYLETGKVLTVAIGAHQLNIYSSFHNCMGRLKREYVIHQQLITKKHCTYMEYWGELEDD